MSREPQADNFTDDLPRAARDDLLVRLRAIADHFSVDPNSGVVSLTNGAARIDLLPDGRVRVTGTSIVQTASESIALDAAWIDLN